MNRRVFALALACALAAPATFARYPEREQMDAVRSAARQLAEQTEALSGVARDQYYDYRTLDPRALEGFQELNRRAIHFHEEVEKNWRKPEKTEDEYEALKTAYGRALAWFGGLRDTPRAAAAKSRVQALMRDLSRRYENAGRPYEPPSDVNWHNLRGLAQAIGRQATLLYDEARRDASVDWTTGADKRRALESLRHLHEESTRYLRTVLESSDAPGGSWDAYLHLKSDFDAAAPRMDCMNRATRKLFAELDRLIDRARQQYIDPPRALGERRGGSWEDDNRPTSHRMGRD